MAHFTLVTAGSRGDIQPYIALGRGLQARGHTARLATHALYADWIRGHGLEFAPVEGDPMAAFQHEHGREWLETGRRGNHFLRGFHRYLGPLLRQATADTVVACADSDLILFSGVAFYVTYSAAEKLNKPFLQAYLQPINPTRAFPSVIYPTRRKGGGIFNYATHAMGGYQIWLRLRPVLNEIRRDLLDLPPMPLLGPFPEMFLRKLPVVHGYSPTLLPKPRDWSEALFVPGFWFLDEDDTYQPPAELARFLADGSPPIYVGFGSMTGNDPERLTRITLEALRLSGQRAVLLSGWAGLAAGDVPPEVLRLDGAPHSWLFPRMAAIVHHGGIGTTHEALRASVPQAIAPFFADQPFWADRVHALGVSPPPVLQGDLTAEHLADAIRAAVSDTAMRERAAEVGCRVRAERGVDESVELIERYLGQGAGFFEGWRGGVTAPAPG
jgi:UDP:flavonoid glycosyltransferase YjiC (YdhE family)